MTDGFNRVTLFGNLGNEPELRTTASGLQVLTFRLATNESYLDRDRNRQERTEWHTVVLFGARAEPLARLLSKGSRVLVEGRLRTTSYEKDGTRRYKTEVVASDLCLGGERRPGSLRPAAGARAVEDNVPF